MRRLVLAPFVSLVAALAACGDSKDSKPGPAAPPSAAMTAEDAAKAQLTRLLDAVKAGNAADAARSIAYSGKDDARRNREPFKYEGDEAKTVDGIVARVKSHLDAGAPSFEKFEKKAKKKGTEEWIAWFVRFGEGEKAKRAVYALVGANGTWLLGDID